MEGTTRQASCEERLPDHMAGRLASLQEAFAAVDDPASDDQLEEAQEAIDQMPLAISRQEVWRVCLSTGGPGDDFYVTYDRENDVVDRIEYRFIDWFDGARHDLEGEWFDLVERFARHLTADFYMEQG